MQVKMNGYVMNPSWLYCTCCMPPLPVNGGFVRMCKRGTIQFVFLKPILAVITIILFTQGKYTEGFWGPSNGCVTLACACSVTTALAQVAGLTEHWVPAHE